MAPAWPGSDLWTPLSTCHFITSLRFQKGQVALHRLLPGLSEAGLEVSLRWPGAPAPGVGYLSKPEVAEVGCHQQEDVIGVEG